ncbi:hypothetical protein VTL71DRAFT_13104 [Oculimacula yallundae]|uniref:Uncharacterized protein n=1 Tax=Oculimacula yallundae TaxID=86028 RepID=A0ABR4CS14_9HELO
MTDLIPGRVLRLPYKISQSQSKFMCLLKTSSDDHKQPTSSIYYIPPMHFLQNIKEEQKGVVVENLYRC